MGTACLAVAGSGLSGAGQAVADGHSPRRHAAGIAAADTAVAAGDLGVLRLLRADQFGLLPHDHRAQLRRGRVSVQRPAVAASDRHGTGAFSPGLPAASYGSGPRALAVRGRDGLQGRQLPARSVLHRQRLRRPQALGRHRQLLVGYRRLAGLAAAGLGHRADRRQRATAGAAGLAARCPGASAAGAIVHLLRPGGLGVPGRPTAGPAGCLLQPGRSGRWPHAGLVAAAGQHRRHRRRFHPAPLFPRQHLLPHLRVQLAARRHLHGRLAGGLQRRLGPPADRQLAGSAGRRHRPAAAGGAGGGAGPCRARPKTGHTLLPCARWPPPCCWCCWVSWPCRSAM